MASLCIPKLLSRSLPTMACTVWHYNYQLVLVAIVVIAITETFWQIIPVTIADYGYKSLKVQIFYSSFSLKSSQIFSTSLVLVGSSSLTSNGGTLRPSFGPLWKRRSLYTSAFPHPKALSLQPRLLELQRQIPSIPDDHRDSDNSKICRFFHKKSLQDLVSPVVARESFLVFEFSTGARPFSL